MCVPALAALALSGCVQHNPQDINISLPSAALHDPALGSVSLDVNDALRASKGGPLNSGLVESDDQRKTANVAAQLMMREHYLNHPLDAQMSAKVFDEYLDALDPRHLYLLASDVKEFEPYRSRVGDMLLKGGDVTPAFQIYTRLLQRIDEESAYVNELLKTETFTFTGDENYQIDRKNLPRPASLDQAKQQWREFLRYEYLQEKLNKQKPDEIVKTLTRRYARQDKALHAYDSDDVFELYLNALAHAYDPHSDYLGKSELAQFNIQMRLSVYGIGAMLQSEDGYAKIEELTPGGPAEKSGLLHVGDRIAGVAQGESTPVETVDLKLNKVVEMIRGPKGTKVRLTIIPAAAPDPSTRKTIEITRDEVKLEEQEAKARIIDMPVDSAPNAATVRMGVIDLPSFYADFDAKNNGERKSTTTDVARLVKKLQAEKVAGIILDLRRNPGGSLQEVINLTGLFIKPGPVVQVKDNEGHVQADDSKQTPVLYDGPLVVLTSRMSASASEIMAGALQDYGRALIVGDTSTFGKGTVQTVLGLNDIMQRNNLPVKADPGALKLTIQKFYRASGGSTQLKGVESDIVLPSLTQYIDYGEKTLDNPMKYDTVPAASYTGENRIAPLLPELKRRSDARIAKDRDFAYLQQEIDQFKKLVAQKSVSLNEGQRIKEKQEAEARVKARREELLKRPAPHEKVYLVTLENLDKPGLTLAPPPKNALKAAGAKTQNPNGDDAAAIDGPATPAIDTTLTESERILEDMIDLSRPGGKAVVKTGR